jgi:uncharacterized membrane protein YbaN (DUF454 family)
MGLGIIGVFIPILPTTPFMLLAATCYIRSSERFYRWLLNNRILGVYVKNYVEGKEMPLRVKIFTILLLWATIGLTIIFGVQNAVVRVVLISVAIGVTIHISRIRKKQAKGA